MKRLLWVMAIVAWIVPARAAELDGLKLKLEGADEGKAEEAAHALGEERQARAVDMLLDALSVGAPPKVQAAILAALASKKDPRAAQALVRYARNRNPELRKKALVALADLSDSKAVPTLLAALSDSVEEVRGTAAQALARRKEKAAIEPLLKLLERKDTAAASALAALATPELARRVAELLGRIPDALYCQTLGEMLKRSDFGPEATRVEVVKVLAKVPGADSTATLVEYIAQTEKEKTRPSHVEAQKIVDQRSGQ